ncbi:hypothetical protein [Clostridium sp.]|uniref:hypothetical protein n=1 Tax=Clostridium sp. TaxID=1506 RepID=UPI003F333FD9
MIGCFEKFTLHDVSRSLDRKEMKIGVTKYIYIMNIFNDINVSTDNTFKTVYIDFYKLGVNTNENFLNKYFILLEDDKTNSLEFIDALRYLYKYSKKVHASFASKLLATVNPELPIIDKFIRNHLELEAYFGVSNIDKIIEQYYEIVEIYRCFLNTNQSKEWIRLFDEKFPYNNITPIKKIDFILWQIR